MAAGLRPARRDAGGCRRSSLALRPRARRIRAAAATRRSRTEADFAASAVRLAAACPRADRRAGWRAGRLRDLVLHVQHLHRPARPVCRGRVRRARASRQRHRARALRRARARAPSRAGLPRGWNGPCSNWNEPAIALLSRHRRVAACRTWTVQRLSGRRWRRWQVRPDRGSGHAAVPICRWLIRGTV